MAAKNEASKMLNFEAVIISASLNARLAMNILIVKPMPPKSEMPIMWRQFKSGERLAIPVFTARNEVRKIPTNFPTIRPQIIPIELEVRRLLMISFGNTIAVLAKAKMGRIKNATG